MLFLDAGAARRRYLCAEITFYFQIIHEIQKYEIQIYQLPYCDDDEDDDYKKQTEELRVR